MKVREMIEVLEQLHPDFELYLKDSWNEVQVMSKPVIAYCNEDIYGTFIEDGCWDYCYNEYLEEDIVKFYVFDDL